VSTDLRATYRVQFHAGFGFAEVAAISDYLAELGISHLYCSPYLQAAPGSTHGYDVVNHQKVNQELGGAEGHARLTTVLKEQNLGQVLDIVPNHMAIVGEVNPWWWDVLENGPSSCYAAYFDVEWDPPEVEVTQYHPAPCFRRPLRTRPRARRDRCRARRRELHHQISRSSFSRVAAHSRRHHRQCR
jgi:maltooligosyltrehalose synthase